MDNLDSFIRETFVPFRQRLIKVFEEKHPHLFSFVRMMLSGKRFKVGLQVTENGQIAGNYTFHVEGVTITGVDSGVLASEINHPIIGLIKPYGIVERSVLERAVGDEPSFVSDPFGTGKKYLPDITIKFLP